MGILNSASQGKFKPYFKRHSELVFFENAPRKENSQNKYYTAKQLAEIYGFPEVLGTGPTIAIIELGGGYLESDLTKYWSF